VIVFFDIGETLVHGPPEGPAARIASRLGMAREEKRALHRALMTMPFETPAEVGAWLGRADALPAVEEVWHAQERDARPAPGAAATLTALAGDGVRIGLVSNIWKPYLSSTRRHLGDVFDELVPPELQVFSFRVGVAKPSPAIFEHALRVAGVGAEEAVMVGDSWDKDIAPAGALGMQTVHVGEGHAHPVG